MTMVNEAAERLREQKGHLMVTNPGRVASSFVYEVLDEALATERRATTDRLRARVAGWILVPSTIRADLYSILDEEAAR